MTDLELIEANGFKLLPRDPKVNPLFPGKYMLVDYDCYLESGLVPAEDYFAIVGDYPQTLVEECIRTQDLDA